MTDNKFGTIKDYSKTINKTKNEVNKTFVSGWNNAKKEIKKNSG